MSEMEDVGEPVAGPSAETLRKVQDGLPDEASPPPGDFVEHAPGGDSCCMSRRLGAHNPHDLDCPSRRRPLPPPDVAALADSVETDDPFDLDGDRQYAEGLLSGLATEAEDAWRPLELAARALTDERHPKSSDAPLWWAHYVGYLRAALDLVQGESGIPRYTTAERARPVEEVAIGLVASMAMTGGDEVARQVAEFSTTVPSSWSSGRAYLSGAEAALNALDRQRRRAAVQAIEEAATGRELTDVEVTQITLAADDAAWFEGLGRAVVAQFRGDMSVEWRHTLALGVSAALGHTPDEVAGVSI